MDNLKQLIETLGITITSVSAPFNPNMDDSAKMFHWACCLSVKDRPLDGFNVMFSKGGGLLQLKAKPMYYSHGAGIKDIQEVRENPRAYYYDFDNKCIRKHNGVTSIWHSQLYALMLEAAPPTVEEVLDCMLMEASALDYDAFEDWASDFGYDSDSIKARDLFHFIRKQSKNLIKLLGRENFRLAMEMERL